MIPRPPDGAPPARVASATSPPPSQRASYTAPIPSASIHRSSIAIAPPPSLRRGYIPLMLRYPPLTLFLACSPPSPGADAPAVVPPPSLPGPPEAPRRDRAAEPPAIDDAIYFALVDRFANGDPANDGAVDRSDPQAWHGGDLAGLTARLDHIHDLGFRTVWISPVFKSRQEKFHEWGAFHGYWVEDPRAIEPRFGDEDALRALSDGLSDRGMRLIMDVVYNHVGFDAPLTEARPDWFHHNGGIEDWDDPVEAVTHDVHALPDLAQEHPEVYAFLRDASLGWIQRARPDGFRIDAVRHMPADFLARIGADLKAAAGDDFTLLGEMFEGDPVKLAATWRAGDFDAVFDFPLHYAMVDTFCRGAPAGRLASTLSADRHHEDPRRLVTFLDNHDLPRVVSACGGDLAAVERALAFQLTARGTPCVTYGTEAALEGAEEPHNRADMRFDHLPLAPAIRDLLALRRAHPALTGGRDRLLHLDDEVFAYARIASEEAVIIALNTADGPRALALPPDLARGAAVEVLYGEVGPAPRAPGLTLQAGALVIAALTPPAPYPAPTALGAARLTLTASAPRGPGDALALVGAGPELGNWDPSKAPTFAEGALALDYPVGAVLDAKLVIRRADGSVTWQEGANTARLILEDEALELAW